MKIACVMRALWMCSPLVFQGAVAAPGAVASEILGIIANKRWGFTVGQIVLFFNIFVGELLFIIVTSIILARIKIGAFNLSFGVAIVPFLIQFFNFFVGTIQAFVFTLLAIVYLSLALADEH